MDLVDLFVGSEGTLGVVTSVRLRLVHPRPAFLAVLVPVAGDAEAVALTRELRDEAMRVRASADDSRTSAEHGADVAAIEYMDARSLEILREDRVPERVGVVIPPDARALLLVQMELSPEYDRERAIAELAAGAEASGDEISTVPASAAAPAIAGPIASFCRILARHGVLDSAVPALPGEEDRRRALFALREAVPEGVNRRIREAAVATGEPISKSGGDVIVPFDRFEEALERIRTIIRATAVDAAIWGHISDGNVHPNLIVSRGADMEKARAAQLAIGEIAIALGGSPLAEHGTGRNPAKKQLLRALHGDAGVESMRATKRALDPDGLLAPGVLF
jgi:D-lactate dehydrogenase (cytochrome)